MGSHSSLRKEENLEEYIPCLYLPCDNPSNKLVVYFHGNAEDIGLAFDLLHSFGSQLNMHVLAVEYPGYGLYKSSRPDENKIREDAETVYSFLTVQMGIKESSIILFGRSMGTGPSTHLASIKNPCCLLLMSPYTTIRDVARQLLGWMSFLSYVVYERFRNIDAIQRVKCPVFFLHGLQDKLIPHSHTIELNKNCQGLSFMKLPEEMDHNTFDFEQDLVRPFQDFLSKIETPEKEEEVEPFELFFDKQFFQPPQIVLDLEKRMEAEEAAKR